MDLLRFDYSGAFRPEFGITKTQLEIVQGRCQIIRQFIADSDPRFAASTRGSLSPNSVAAGFVWLPRDQLADYVQRRDSSDLGRIFSVANRLHETVDAVVVLGTQRTVLGIQAVMGAGCDPYHNERSRGRRGSKPRMYFGGASFDNDAVVALLHRILDSQGDNPVLQRWAICAIGGQEDAWETLIALRQWLDALKSQLGEDSAKWLPELVFTVASPTSLLAGPMQAVENFRSFEIPQGVADHYSLLGCPGLLPAAILGLDCMQLLHGAAAITENFLAAPFEENVVLQYAAINYLLSLQGGKSVRVLNLWNEALAGLGIWYEHLMDQALYPSGSSVIPLTLLGTRDLHSRAQRVGHSQLPHTINHLVVRKHRLDPIHVELRETEVDPLNCLGPLPMAKINQLAREAWTHTLGDWGRPTTVTELAEICPHGIGQLFQMMMLATMVESQLWDAESSNLPCLDQYHARLRFSLGLQQ